MADRPTQAFNSRFAVYWLPSTFSALFVLTVVVISVNALYRLYLHPLRKIPGPRAAALSSLYRFYWNFSRDGQYVKLFPSLHEKYESPVIRIAPNHVHVNEPEFYDQVFSVGSEYLKDPCFYLALGADGAMLSIIDPHELQTYRKGISSLFSARNSDAVLPTLLSKLEAISSYMLECQRDDDPIDIQRLYRALAADITCDALFARNPDFLGSGHQYHPLLSSLEEFTAGTWMIIQFPAIRRFIESLPYSWQQRMTPELLRFKEDCEVWVLNAIDQRNAGQIPERKSLFNYYLDMNPQDARTSSLVPKLVAAAFDFLNAGIDPTAYTLSCATYHILNSPRVLSRLQTELDEAVSLIRPSFDTKQIQSLPYLRAVIKEALRISNVAPGCLPRVVPKNGACVGGVNIPANTVISVSQYAINTNKTIFPDPHEFFPERWLGDEGKQLEKWNVSFSKGTRRCAGINFAYLELYTCIAYLFSRFDMSLYETDRASMEWSDRIVAHNKSHVRVKVRGERWK